MKKILLWISLCFCVSTLAQEPIIYETPGRVTVIDTTSNDLYSRYQLQTSGQADINAENITSGDLTLTGTGVSKENLTITHTEIVALDGTANTGTDLEFAHTYEAFKFTTTSSIAISSFAVYAKATGTITNVTDYWEMWIYSDNAGSPGTKVGVIQEYARYGYLTTDYQNIPTQTAPQTLNASTSYWIVMKRNAAATGGTVYLDTKNEGTAQYAYSTNGTAWTTGNSVTGKYVLYTTLKSGIKVTGINYPSIDAYNTTEYGVRATSIMDFGGLFQSTNNGGSSSTSTYGAGAYNVSIHNHGTASISTNGYGGYNVSTNGTGLYSQTTSTDVTKYGGWVYNYGKGSGMYLGSDSLYGGFAYSKLDHALYANTSASAAASKAAVYGLNSGGGRGVQGVSVSGNGGYFSTTSGIGSFTATTSGARIADFQSYPSSTNTITSQIKISRLSSGTAAAGIGGSIDLYAQSGTGNERMAGKISWSHTNVTNTAEESNVKIGVMHAGTNVDRVITGSKVLADGSATGICTIALPTLAMTGGIIEYTVTATDGTDMQSVSGIVKFQYVNKAASYTGTIELASTAEDDAVSAGTLTGAWTITTGTNVITINANYDSSLTTPTMVIYYNIKNNSKQAVTIL